MPDYRQQTSGVLNAEAACTSCAQPCGGSGSIPSGDQGYYNLDFDAGATASDIGAVIIYFNPISVPDGIRVQYDGSFYNATTNNSSGRIQTPSGVTGAFTILGSPSNSCMPSSYPHTQDYNFYDGLTSGNPPAWNNTGTQQSITINAGDYIGGGASMWNTLVIPKTSQSENIVSIQVLGHCSTGWSVEVECPAALPFVNASVEQATTACEPTQNTPMYFARNNNDSNNVPGLYNFVFSDENGANPLNPTSTSKFYISAGKAYEVKEGVVISSVSCT
jgi:hypothetical protein